MTGCPLGGPRCSRYICDCFVDQFPNDPLGLHPELFEVDGRPVPDPDDDDERDENDA